MENLSERFNALQDQLMNIYEAAEQTLEAQIKHWQTLRQEAVLLFYAREKGVRRLGYQPVPVKAVSEAKAKEAIGMVLQLQSLQTSDYANEPWTLVDTSIETFRSAPDGHFKKGPVPVEVIYDNDTDNANMYTMWTYVYYVEDDVWHKAKSGVNETGIYYLQGTFKSYYVLFADDARKYSTTGQWEVKLNKDTIFTPVTSSTPPGSPGGQADTNTSSKTPTSSTATVDSTTRQLTTAEQPQQTQDKGRRYGRRASSRSRRPQTKQRRSRSRHRSRSQSQTPTSRSTTSRSRSTSLSKTGVRRRATTRSRSRERASSASRRRGGRRRRSRSPSTSSSTANQRSQRARAESTGSRGARGARGARGGSSGGRGRRRGRSTSSSPAHKRARGQSARVRGISPDQVGGSLRSVSSKHTGRLGRLLEEALDPPVILVRGEANTLKCFRNRAKITYKGLFRSFSTTWSWVAGDGTERLGRPRMLISFSSYNQRRDFDDVVRYPKGVEKSYGNLDSL